MPPGEPGHATDRAEAHRPSTDIVGVAVWFALVGAAAEMAVLGVWQLTTDNMLIMLFVPPQVVWMAPLAYLAFFCSLAVAMTVAARWWPALRSLRAAVLVFGFLAAFGLLVLFHPHLHKAAGAVLAAGVTAVVARMTAAHPAGFHGLVRRTLGWSALAGRRPALRAPPPEVDSAPLSRRHVLLGGGVTVAGLAAGVQGWRGLREYRLHAALPAPSTAALNVLLITLDTVRAASLSAYGYARPTTPRLERFAREGTLFSRAIATSPWTLPSHASMFTGHWAHELSTEWRRPLDSAQPTLAEFLAHHGYATVGFVANRTYCGAQTGLGRGFARYADREVSAGEVVLSSSLGRFVTNSPTLRHLVGYHEVLGRKDATTVSEAFLRWLDARAGRPFFAFLNYWDAHEPYLPPSPFDTMFGPRRRGGHFVHRATDAWRAAKWTLGPEDVQVERDMYEGAIAYLDQQLGALLDELDRRGLRERTLTIVTSDHGEQLGEHGLFGHVNSLYLPLLHVPLVIAFPGRVAAGMMVDAPVSLRDIAATVADLLGLGSRSPFPGRSLARHWHGAHREEGAAEALVLSELTPGTVEQPWYPVARGNMRSLITSRHHYIRNGDGSEELYDLEADRDERSDLALTAEGRALVAGFRERLATVRRAAAKT